MIPGDDRPAPPWLAARPSRLGLAALLLAACSGGVSSDPASTRGPGESGLDSGLASNASTATETQTETGAGQSSSVSSFEGSDDEASEASSTDADEGAFDDESESDDDPSLRFDLPIVDQADTDPTGCAKVDFLFVIDNSSSMGDEQQNLIRSFPGFIQGIRDQLQAQDYHVMVADSDGIAATQMSTCAGGECTCQTDPICCAKICSNDSSVELCNAQTCAQILDEHACELDLGVGRRHDDFGHDCMFGSDDRYMRSDHPDLDAAFACAAYQGAHGSDKEQPMHAMLRALDPEMTDPGACNAGFLRKDAILVVTVITDEEDDHHNDGSPGDPRTWFDRIVELKHGNEKAAVLIGFIGDRDLQDPICEPLSGTDGAEASPRLREFFELAGGNGLVASVCEPDYAPAFAKAIAAIDLACDDFDPPE